MAVKRFTYPLPSDIMKESASLNTLGDVDALDALSRLKRMKTLESECLKTPRTARTPRGDVSMSNSHNFDNDESGDENLFENAHLNFNVGSPYVLIPKTIAYPAVGLPLPLPNDSLFSTDALDDEIKKRASTRGSSNSLPSSPRVRQSLSSRKSLPVILKGLKEDGSLSAPAPLHPPVNDREKKDTTACRVSFLRAR